MYSHNTIKEIYFICGISCTHIHIHIFPIPKLCVKSTKALQKIAPEHTYIHLGCHDINGKAIRPAEFVQFFADLRSTSQTQPQVRLPMFPDALAVEPSLLVSEQEFQIGTKLEGLRSPAQIFGVGPMVIVVQEGQYLAIRGRNASIADNWQTVRSAAALLQQ